MLPPLIALYSPCAQQGKSTVASILTHEYAYQLVKLAGPLKAMLRVYLAEWGIPPADIERYIEGDLKEKLIPGVDKTARHLMRTLGTEWGRDQVGPGSWVRLARMKIMGLIKAGKRVVVDDMRFEEEYFGLNLLSAKMIQVIRPGHGEAKADHRSEGGLSGVKFHHTIINRGTMNELVGTVTGYMDQFIDPELVTFP